MSEIGKGSTFWFSIECSDICNPKKKFYDFDDALNKTTKIMVVSNNQRLQKELVSFFRYWQMDNDCTTNISDALGKLFHAQLENQPYSICFIDEQLPKLSGKSVCESITHLKDIQPLVVVPIYSKTDEQLKTSKMISLIRPIIYTDVYHCLMKIIDPDQSKKQETIKDYYLPESDNHLHNKKVLVVEDNKVNQKVAKGILKRLGIHCDIAGNGQEALSILQKKEYDLVFMDVQMPVMDGLTASRAIRNQSTKVLQPNIPIVAMTAHAMQDSRQECLKAGMDDFISKPIDPSEVFSVIERFPNGVQVYQENTMIEQTNDPLKSIQTGAEMMDDLEPVDEKYLFDYEKFALRMGNDEELVQMVIEEFMLDVPVRLDTLEREIDTGNIESACINAHSIKGSAANLNALHLKDLASELEHLAKDKAQTGELVSKLKELRQAFDKVKPFLEKS
ncbi:MAG: response regulator [Candidatus Magnetomorum sp.]|nr:response regulator [Candidatus Magnetomorum sp.]